MYSHLKMFLLMNASYFCDCVDNFSDLLDLPTYERKEVGPYRLI